MPQIGDEVTTDDGIHILVKDVSQNRITKVIVTLPATEDPFDEAVADPTATPTEADTENN